MLDAGLKHVGVPRSYIARFDLRGRRLFELRDERHRRVNNVVPISPDDVIFVGHQNHYGREPDKFWLQRVSAAGRVLWERFIEHGSSRSFGAYHQSAAAALNDGRIAVLQSNMRKVLRIQSTANICAFGYSPTTGSQSATSASAMRWTVDI